MREMAAITTAILPAIRVNTPVTPNDRSVKAMAKEENTTESRL
jgi:hypothetical protein